MSISNRYISLGVVSLEIKDYMKIFSGCSSATIALIENIYALSQTIKVENAKLQSVIDSDSAVVDIESLAQILSIKPRSVLARIRRSNIFEKKDGEDFTVYLLKMNSDVLIRRASVRGLAKEKKKKTQEAKRAFENKYRTRPPLKIPSEITGMVKTPLADFSSLCVPGNTIVHEKNFYVTVNVGGKNINTVVLATGGRGVVNEEDFKTLYALIILSIQYHNEYKENYIKHGDKPENMTPIYADVLLEFMGKNNDREAREELWRQIGRLRTTEYDMHSITRGVGETLKDYFVNDQFRFIERTPSLSDTAFDASSEKEAAAPFYYEIVWHDLVFDSIFENSYFFALPPGVFRESTQMFTLYLTLRKKMRANKGESGDFFMDSCQLQDLYLSEANKYNFTRRFMANLTKVVRKELKGKLDYAKKNASKKKPIVVEREFYGFRVQLLVTGSVSFEGIRVIYNLDDVLEECRVKKNTKGGVSTPTIPNPLSFFKDTVPSKKSLDSDFSNHEVNLRTLHNNARPIIKSAGIEIEKTSFSMIVTVAHMDGRLMITKSTGDNRIHDFIDGIVKSYGKDMTPLLVYLLGARNKLNQLSFGKKAITDSDIGALRKTLSKNGDHFSFDEIFDCLAQNQAARKALANNGPCEDTANIVSIMM